MKVSQPTLAEAEYAPGDLVRLRGCRPTLLVQAINLRLSGDAETGWEQLTEYIVVLADVCGGLEFKTPGTSLELVEQAPTRRRSVDDRSDAVDLFEPISALPATEPFEVMNAAAAPEQLDGVW